MNEAAATRPPETATAAGAPTPADLGFARDGPAFIAGLEALRART